MSVAATARPIVHSFGDLSASSSAQGSDSPQNRPAVRSHYRPYSTLSLEGAAPPPVVPVPFRNSVLLKVRRQSTLHRSLSLSDAMGLGKKKAGEKEKEKVPVLVIRKLSDLSESTPAPTAATSAKREMSQRPSTSAGVPERKNGALHRVKAQRSIGSLFAAATDVSPSLEHPPRSKPAPPTIPPTAFRPRKMDVIPKRPRTPSNPRLRSQSKVDVEEGIHHKNPDPNIWFTRSRTKVHPYTKEVPYMQAYDVACLENDRYSELLLERLNPGSPSFHDFGKKPPLSVLDLGCGQGHWVLYAASVWKNSRITGFDLMEITLPAFQTTENVNFIRGNFLTKLPFPAKTFDYIRMANLSLCIPYSDWLPLLTEVRRILTNGGRLEVIDDQIIFPYGEEPQLKDTPMRETPGVEDIASTKAYSPAKSSFFDIDDDIDKTDGSDSDTLEDETSTSTTSTLVNDGDLRNFYEKLPPLKRTSGQSNASTVNSESGYFDSVKPLRISVTNTAPLQATISPSPTVTQATFCINDPDSPTISQSPTITGRDQHRKTSSCSSTKSMFEALATWKSKKLASTEMEVIFEHVLIHKYGIHPRPSEFIVDTMRNIFGKGNAGKVKSFHIKLAPFDSLIGPGGALAPVPKTDDIILNKAEKADKKNWMYGEKKEKKEKKRERRKLEKPESPRSSIEESAPNPMARPALISAKAASRLGLVPLATISPRRISPANSTASDSSTSSTEARPKATVRGAVVSVKAAGRLGIPVSIPPPIPPKSAAIRNSYINNRHTEVSWDDESANIADPQKNQGASSTTDSAPASPRDLTLTPRTLRRGGSDMELSYSGTNTSDSEESTSSTDLSNEKGRPPTISAKAAGRLGISYSVLAAASATHSRNSGVMAPVQSPGILVWPSTYVPMSPTELEMHSCKHVQALLGCRHALREFITSDFDGQKLADDADFEEAIWDYECFRRSRFLWPNDNPDLFDEDSFPESPVTTPNATQDSHRITSISRNDSVETYNGQHRSSDLTHIRTIRVFEAVKAIDEKGLMSMLFSGRTGDNSRQYDI